MKLRTERAKQNGVWDAALGAAKITSASIRSGVVSVSEWNVLFSELVRGGV